MRLRVESMGLSLTGKRATILLAASAGGHLNQLLQMQPAWADCADQVYVSSLEVAREKLARRGKCYIVGECNREHPIRALQVFWRAFRICRQERPAAVLSTGAAPGLACCLFGKLFGARIVWVDSIANTEKLSMSGRLARPFADLVLSQWAEVADKYPNVEYCGALL